MPTLEERQKYKSLLFQLLRDISAVEQKYLLADNFGSDDWWEKLIDEYKLIASKQEYESIPYKNKMIMAFSNQMEAFVKSFNKLKEGKE